MHSSLTFISHHLSRQSTTITIVSRRRRLAYRTATTIIFLCIICENGYSCFDNSANFTRNRALWPFMFNILSQPGNTNMYNLIPGWVPQDSSDAPRRKHMINNLQHKQLAKTTKIIAFYYWPWRYENTLQWYHHLLQRVQRIQIY